MSTAAGARISIDKRGQYPNNGFDERLRTGSAIENWLGSNNRRLRRSALKRRPLDGAYSCSMQNQNGMSAKPSMPYKACIPIEFGPLQTKPSANVLREVRGEFRDPAIPIQD